METELIMLAEAGAAALVKAMATDLWPSTKRAVAAMFHRDDPDRAPAIDAQLDRNDVLVAQAEAPDDVRRELFGYWVLELAALLRRDPSSGDPLGQLAASVSSALTDGHPVFEQSNNAQGHGMVFATQGHSQVNNLAIGVPPAPAEKRDPEQDDEQ